MSESPDATPLDEGVAAEPGAERRSFEVALSELERRVRRLETGDLPLEEALNLFEEGVRLTRECHEHLDAADQRIIELSED